MSAPHYPATTAALANLTDDLTIIRTSTMRLFSKRQWVSATVIASILLVRALGSTATASQPPIATIQRLTAGDRACYVELKDDSGKTSTEFAEFNICEQQLVGKRVRLTYESGNILAEACQGNLDCGKSETVMLISRADVLAPVNAPTKTIQALADGNYRYWNGTTNQSIVSDETLLANGGIVFHFRKQGNNVSGVFSYVDGEAICVKGQANGNTVSGRAVQTLQGASVRSAGESFASFGPSKALSVRRGYKVNRQVVRYDSALLNLAGMNRINVGSRTPRGCV
ncbi:hypothetical protein [Trichocoleus sp. FACHB-591]|uniref:hypothetical protein n=1 Tax=Trichocoleus sp. FACHB-591 TaxID=2692872 RepID=UPI001684C8A9|nr:hypothetical protein [Trichocoleus sp. FACHB-591]